MWTRNKLFSSFIFALRISLMINRTNFWLLLWEMLHVQNEYLWFKAISLISFFVWSMKEKKGIFFVKDIFYFPNTTSIVSRERIGLKFSFWKFGVSAHFRIYRFQNSYPSKMFLSLNFSQRWISWNVFQTHNKYILDRKSLLKICHNQAFFSAKWNLFYFFKIANLALLTNSL